MENRDPYVRVRCSQVRVRVEKKIIKGNPCHALIVSEREMEGAGGCVASRHKMKGCWWVNKQTLWLMFRVREGWWWVKIALLMSEHETEGAGGCVASRRKTKVCWWVNRPSGSRFE